MAKTTCAFCGKEVTTGLFKGDANTFSFGLHDVICCPHCWEQYHDDMHRIKNRFKIKLNNYATATKTRKLDNKFIADAIVRYLAEEKAQIARCGTITNATNAGYFAVDCEKGYFAIREFELGRDATSGETLRNLKKAEDVGEVWFSKEDITRMEYATTTFGSSSGLFSSTFTFEIRLNDEKEITYKPCIARASFLGKGLFPHNQKKNAKDQCANALKILKDTIGADVPVVNVSRLV